MTVLRSQEEMQARVTALAATSNLTPLETAILRTVAYADVFDYPLTEHEIHRFLIDIPATEPELHSALTSGGLVPECLEVHGSYYVLAGRSPIISVREQRAHMASDLWQVALQYAKHIARIPFVRMVAVTGALAVDNPAEADDIDYLIVTELGRLWLCRAMVIGIVKLAQRRGHHLCPNFFLSERELHIADQSLFSAHELAQMIPLAGADIYQRMMDTNGWMMAMLPNTNRQARRFEIQSTDKSRIKLAGEMLLHTRVGGWLEQWEMRRKIDKLTRQSDEAPTMEVAFSADRCQGHFSRHRERTLDAYSRRLHLIEDGSSTANETSR
jgi:hypothetical protein